MAVIEIITKIDATTHPNSVYFSINSPPDENGHDYAVIIEDFEKPI